MTGKIFFRISVVALFTVGAIAHAMALSFKNISGKWCSKDGDYNFRPDMLMAKFHDRTPTRRLKVVATITVPTKSQCTGLGRARNSIPSSANSAPMVAR